MGKNRKKKEKRKRTLSRVYKKIIKMKKKEE